MVYNKTINHIAPNYLVEIYSGKINCSLSINEKAKKTEIKEKFTSNFYKKPRYLNPAKLVQRFEGVTQTKRFDIKIACYSAKSDKKGLQIYYKIEDQVSQFER